MEERFYVNKVDDTNWEDLQYAEEIIGKDKGPQQTKETKQAKKFNDPKEYVPVSMAEYT